MSNSITCAQAIVGSPKEKVAYMKSIRFEHQALKEVQSEVQRQMAPCSGVSVIILVGPTGVGKTTFGRLLLRDLLKSYEIELQEDPSSIPAVLSEVDAFDGKEINWVLFYERVCSDLLSPSLLEGRGAASTEEGPVDKVKSSRLKFENAIKRRKVRNLILDEVIHFTKSNTDPLQYGNLLKSLSNRAGMNLLLIGAYGSEDLALSSDQLARRISVVHFPRYHDTKNDFVSYAEFIRTIAKHIPLASPVDLRKLLPHLFVGSCGLCGFAVDILAKAVGFCAADGGRWSDSYLFAAMPSTKAQRKIARETAVGEQAVKDFLQYSEAAKYATEGDIRAELSKEEGERKHRSGGRSA
jgi:DNA polymerase III delta prime subunit